MPISISKDMLGDKKLKDQEIKQVKELSGQEADLVKRLSMSKAESKFEFLGLHFARHKQTKDDNKPKGGGPNTDLSRRYGKKGKECKDPVDPEENH